MNSPSILTFGHVLCHVLLEPGVFQVKIRHSHDQNPRNEDESKDHDARELVYLLRG